MAVAIGQPPVRCRHRRRPAPRRWQRSVARGVQRHQHGDFFGLDLRAERMGARGGDDPERSPGQGPVA